MVTSVRYGSILDTIGNTPVVEIAKLSPRREIRLLVKLEGVNPSGSVKDRVAKYLIEDAEARGELRPGRVVLEPTSGNTGIALAMVCRHKGYPLSVVMPDNLTAERYQALKAFGADIIFSEGVRGTNGAVELAQELAADPRYFMPFQYANDANPRAHYETTGSEIIADVPDLDVFVAGLGTGGTLTGAGRRLKEHNPTIQIVAAEPLPGDPVQGLRSLDEGYRPPVLDESVIDRKILVSNRDAVIALRRLLNAEGIFAGVSSGAILHAALRVASGMRHGTLLALLPDGGWKYLSSDLWTQDLGTLEPDMERHVWW